MYPAIVRRFGPPPRDVGSGLLIPEWDIDGGVLTMSLEAENAPAVPPSFVTADGRTFWLIQSHNLAGANLVAQFELTTVPDSNHGSAFWVGDLKLNPDNTFEFTDSRANPAERHGFAGSFLTKYPKGSYEIYFLPGISAATTLENLSGDTWIAKIVLSSPDHKHELQTGVRSDSNHRLLYLTSLESGKLPFTAEKIWDHAWE